LNKIAILIFLLFFGGCVALNQSNTYDKSKNSANIESECKCKSVTGCNDIGVAYELDGNVKNAIKCYEIACNGGVGVACSNLGSIYQNQKSKNESEILAIFLKACDLGSKFGCYNAANLYRLSKKPNYDMAVILYKKSCEELEHASSCTNLGAIYQFILGKPDLKLAKQLYKKGCELGDENGCKNLSLIVGD
jgi:hcpE